MSTEIVSMFHFKPQCAWDILKFALTKKIKSQKSTSVEQAVACAPFTQQARVRSPIGTSFVGEVFSVFNLTCKTNVKKLQAHNFPEYHLTVIIVIHIRLVRINGCVNGVYRFSYSCCLGGGPGIEVIPHPGRFSMSLCGRKSMYVIQS